MTYPKGWLGILCVLMKLPNCENAIVEQKKIESYLLNTKHQYGASKARFFAKFGFCNENWEQLSEALLKHGQQRQVVSECETGFGPRYLVECELDVPDGHCPCIRTVWQLDKGMINPRLITAYPLEKKL